MHIRQQALENGLICYPVGGNVDGINGDVVILAPPYNSTRCRARRDGGQDGEVSIQQVLAAKGLGLAHAASQTPDLSVSLRCQHDQAVRPRATPEAGGMMA